MEIHLEWKMSISSHQAISVLNVNDKKHKANLFKSNAVLFCLFLAQLAVHLMARFLKCNEAIRTLVA